MASAQTTEFTYQGSLKDGGGVASGNYDFQFALFNAASGGAQLGSTLAKSVTVSEGIFSVNLDFGNQFDGSARFLEIRVRNSGAANFTTLTPRQPVNSTPHAVKALSAGQLNGVDAGQYVVTTDRVWPTIVIQRQAVFPISKMERPFNLLVIFTLAMPELRLSTLTKATNLPANEYSISGRIGSRKIFTLASIAAMPKMELAVPLFWAMTRGNRMILETITHFSATMPDAEIRAATTIRFSARWRVPCP